MAKKPNKSKRKPNFLNDVFITGTLRFPKLNEPDEYEGKVFYSSPVVVDAAELSRVKKLLTDFGKKSFPDAEKIWLPIKRDKKDDSIVFFDIKWKKEDDEGNLKRPLIVDAKRKQVKGVQIGAGTLVKIKVTGMDFEPTKLTGDLPGVTLLPEAIQIKKLVEGRDALAGFSDDEEGWSADGEQDIEAGEGTETSGDAYDL
jgi:hypothetical protein